MSGTVYYNESNAHAAGWLERLGVCGHITAGRVDGRDIRDVAADDVRHFRRCHWFAGIGGWELALHLAGWPDWLPVWTGSCPCQPYSAAGKNLGDKDPRNLWPVWFPLIRECRPEFIFGEQVDKAIGHGWLDGISADMEKEGYAVGSVVLGAHSLGSPQVRNRLYWVAHAGQQSSRKHERHRQGFEAGDREGEVEASREPGRYRGAGGMAGAFGERIRGQGHGANGGPEVGMQAKDRERQRVRPDARSGDRAVGSWDRFDVVHCRDGKARRFEPGSFPLADGIPERMDLLRGFGNAIVPQVAAEFIQAFLETEES